MGGRGYATRATLGHRGAVRGSSLEYFSSRVSSFLLMDSMSFATALSYSAVSQNRTF